jgi:hypothetical protein
VFFSAEFINYFVVGWFFAKQYVRENKNRSVSLCRRLTPKSSVVSVEDKISTSVSLLVFHLEMEGVCSDVTRLYNADNQSIN